MKLNNCLTISGLQSTLTVEILRMYVFVEVIMKYLYQPNWNLLFMIN